MYFYYKLLIISVTTQDITIIMKVMILVTVLVFGCVVLRIIPHLVTNNLMKIGLAQNNFLIIFLLVKLTQTSEDLSDNLKILMEIITFILVLVSYIYILTLMIRMMAIKLMHMKIKLAKFLKILLFETIFDSIFFYFFNLFILR
jgi:hypothetical protein